MAEESQQNISHETKPTVAGEGAVEYTDRGLFDFMKKKEEKLQDQELINTTTAEFDHKVPVSEQHKPPHMEEPKIEEPKVEEEEKKPGLFEKLHRSGSSSSSSERNKMNVQAHMSAGRVPNQAPGGASGGDGVVPQQHNMVITDSERDYVRDRIFSILLHHQSQPVDETSRMKFRDISKRLEKGLFEAAHTKEDYMNMKTLEPRLHSLLIKGRSGNNHNKRHQNSTCSIRPLKRRRL